MLAFYRGGPGSPPGRAQPFSVPLNIQSSAPMNRASDGFFFSIFATATVSTTDLSAGENRSYVT